MYLTCSLCFPGTGKSWQASTHSSVFSPWGISHLVSNSTAAVNVSEIQHLMTVPDVQSAPSRPEPSDPWGHYSCFHELGWSLLNSEGEQQWFRTYVSEKDIGNGKFKYIFISKWHWLSCDFKVKPLHLEGLQSCLWLPLVDKQVRRHKVKTCLRSHSDWWRTQIQDLYLHSVTCTCVVVGVLEGRVLLQAACYRFLSEPWVWVSFGIQIF